ncbi:FAD-binding protein [Leptolyngbya sp. DQ-M1]
MTARQVRSGKTKDSALTLETDVLVIGGGLSGTWVAWGAASQGAKVILVDKGYCGTSGSSAPVGNGVWYVQADPDLREQAMASREALGGFLANRQWMRRGVSFSDRREWRLPTSVNSRSRIYASDAKANPASRCKNFRSLSCSGIAD